MSQDRVDNQIAYIINIFIYFCMVFKIRDKSLFWTKSGWKNNYNARTLNLPRPASPLDTAYITTRKDHHSYLRMVQSYRNYSRVCKQYFYGDKAMEHALQMELRVAFRLPWNVSTPVELVRHGCERRMADQLDRDYELMSYNYHPFQLYAYKLQNRRIKQQNEEAEQSEKKELTRSQALEAAFETELAHESDKLPRGEKLSLEKMAEVYSRVVKSARDNAGENLPTRGPDGEYTDYLERRRPLTQANDLGHSH